MYLKLKEFCWGKLKISWNKGLLHKVCIIFWGAAFVSLFFGLRFHFLIEVFSGCIVAAGIVYVGIDSQCNKNREQSKYYLEKYIDICNKILERLQKDTPTRRIAWVTAATMAYSSINFENKVTEMVDQEYLMVFKRDYAHCLGDFLYGKNPEYFYGVDEAIDLDEALLKSSEKEGRCLSKEERYEYLPITKKLLIPILRLAAIPDVQLENKEIENLDELERKFPSIYLYLEHSSKYKFTRDLKTGDLKIIEKNN